MPHNQCIGLWGIEDIYEYIDLTHRSQEDVPVVMNMHILNIFQWLMHKEFSVKLIPGEC